MPQCATHAHSSRSRKGSGTSTPTAGVSSAADPSLTTGRLRGRFQRLRPSPRHSARTSSSGDSASLARRSFMRTCRRLEWWTITSSIVSAIGRSGRSKRIPGREISVWPNTRCGLETSPQRPHVEHNSYPYPKERTRREQGDRDYPPQGIAQEPDRLGRGSNEGHLRRAERVARRRIRALHKDQQLPLAHVGAAFSRLPPAARRSEE